jgi:hypothetical protein
MVLRLDFDLRKRDDSPVPVPAALAQFDHMGCDLRVCRCRIAISGFVPHARYKSVPGS